MYSPACCFTDSYCFLPFQRATVVTGEYEPNDEEADWPSDDEKEDELAVRPLFLL